MKYLPELLLFLGLALVVVTTWLIFGFLAALLAVGIAVVLIALLLDRARR